MDSVENALEENRLLRRTMRDLVALSTLPAVWIGLGPDGIVRSLADVLLNTLSLDLVYVQLAGRVGQAPVEVFRCKHRADIELETLRAALAPLLSTGRAGTPAIIPDPLGTGTLHVAVTRFGVGDDHGVLISGSRNANFPTDRDRVLLGVGANQTAIVAQRQRAEQRLEERQEWLRVTLASIGDAVIATDTDGCITFLNSVAEELTGWAPDEAQGKPLETVFIILNEQTRQPVENPVDKVLRDGSVVGLGNHTVLLARDGTERPIDDSASPIRDAAGKMIGVILIFRDVTEQRRAENRVRQSEARKSAILDAALDCIVTMDHEGTIIEFNPAAERTFGFRSAEAVGRDLAGLIIPEALRERHRRGMAHYLATGDGPVLGQRIEVPALHADGTEFPVELAVTRIPTDGPALFTAYLRDISERTRTERRRNVRMAVTQVLAQAPTIVEAATGVLRAVCEKLDWDVGFFWVLDPRTNTLQCLESWHGPSVTSTELEVASRQRAFSRDEGLPGHAWARGEPIWLPDVLGAVNFPRAASAAEQGLHGAFACPFGVGSETLGVIEFFSRQIREPDPDLLETMATAAGLIGQFVERKQAEEALRQSEARFRGLMEQAPFSIQMFAPNGRTLRVNRAWEELWGVKFEQMDAYNILEDPQLDARGVLRYIQQGFAGQATRIPAIPYNPNETIPGITEHEDPRRWLSAVIYPLKDPNGHVREVVLVHEDVTARKLAEDALRESRERLDLALQASELGHWELRLADHTASRNLRHDQIFGYDSLRSEWTYDTFLAHVVPEDRGAVDAQFRDAVNLRQPWDVECRIRTAKGAVRWIWARGRVFTDDSEQARRMAGTVADITQRKQIEEELRHARSRLEAALRAGAIVTWTWDIPNNQLFGDEPLAKLFGLSPADADGGLLDRYVEAIHPDDLARVSAALSQAVEGGEDYEADYRIMQRDGSVRWVVARGRVERDEAGRALRMPGVLVDITERKRLEEELAVRVEQLAEADRHREELLASLRESEEKLRLLADTIPQLAWMARPDGHIFWFNRRWYEYTGTTPEQMEGWNWQSVHDPEVLPKVLERWNASIVSGEPFDMVFPLKGADQQFRPFLTRVNPLRDQEGHVLYWFGTNTDISDIKGMEEALLDTDRRKDEFLATLAHELRNPLAPIRNALQILKLPRIDASTAEQTREIMERQVQHLVRLVDDLLDVSRVMRGRIELRKEPVELATVIARAVETAQPLLDAQGHQLQISLPPSSLLLDADPIRLCQVVGNLLTNAAKYTEPNGHVSLSARREGDEAVLSVHDDGIGIAPDVLPHVFDLFVQVEHATSRSQGGLGIGLTLVKSLVEMHGGGVEVSSAGLGKGCEFVVRLPLLLRELEAPHTEAAGKWHQEVAPSGLRLLVVDDNEDAALTLATLLELQGHEVRVVHDGPSAIDAARVFRPTLIFLDLGMPGMDGYEVARQVRKTPGLEDVVLAALTGWGQQEDRRRTAEAGFEHHLIKPLEPKALESLLAALDGTLGQ